MEPNRRFSLLTFPQFFDGQTLTLNIVLLPRNQNPLRPAIEQDAVIPDAPAFADAHISFEARIISSLAGFPNNLSANIVLPLPVTQPSNTRALFTALGSQFGITNLDQINNDVNVNNPAADKADEARSTAFPVKKYLPLSYRKAFNFTTPRTRAAVTDDSYHCAVRDAGKVAGFKRSPDKISWGKVFAYALRQPLLARELKMIYSTSFTLDATHFPDGGWLYVDLAAGSDFSAQQQADHTFIRRYAARIPALILNTSRQLFAPILFPVLHKANPEDPDPSPDGNFDQVLIEAAEYDDGFAKIVHAMQPRSRQLLEEQNESGHPVKDMGIRLGWDDEQILIWYLRQLAEDNSVLNPDKRLDAPLGVFGYAVDVRETATPAQQWQSLNGVTNQAPLTVSNLPQDPIPLGDFDDELPYQVYPMQLDGNKSGDYWLPIYFANWNGHNMVLPDSDAAHVYQTNADDVKSDPEIGGTGTGVSGPAQNQLHKLYKAHPVNTQLRYGKQYDFRVRMRDLSGGGALRSSVPVTENPSAVGTCQFKRYVAPNQPRIENLPVNSDAPNNTDTLSVRRPLLGYPAVVYTGKYSDPIGRLRTASENMIGVEAFGIPDPDIDRIEITVEVETLKLDNLLSVSGKENYVHLYTTQRVFPAINNEDDYEAILEIPLVYHDVKVLHTGSETNIEADFGLQDDIDNLQEIYLPTARTVRLTLRAVCEDKDDNHKYYGALDVSNHDRDVRYGPIVEMLFYRESTDETDLFVDSSPSQRLQGIFLQPDAPNVFDGKLTTLLFGKEVKKAPDLVQRLAKQLNLENTGLTLVAPKGERVQFGCSSRIRHTLSPDNSSLTFSSKGDLANHWLCCLQLTIDRDWMWSGLEDQAFVLERSLRFTNDNPNTETEVKIVGDIEVRRAASFESLHNPRRTYTRLVFIDAVEPKNERMQPPPNAQEPRFPDTIEVSYNITTQYKENHAEERDGPEELDIKLPITTPPSQVPKIASAGIALSPYIRNEKYSVTEPRQRFLWVEFEEPVKDPNDTYFVRMLAYTADQLISNNNPALLVAPQEPSIPLDPEEIRVVIPNATNDLAGLHAMQPMTKAADSDRHYLLPLPPGLHADSDELFGFFTYEFRVGHFRNKDTQEMVWSTAQGRFGRRLRATGIQHPAPTLICAVNRDEKKLWVTAPYAVAVSNGKNVTADPPRTQLWCLLYAQVRQADNKDFRNILLDDKQLDWRVQIEPEPEVNRFVKYDDAQLNTLKNITVKNFKDEISYANMPLVYKLVEIDKMNKDAKKYGTVVWSNGEVRQWLDLFGLPADSSLSVLVVEILPQITNIYDHVSGLHKQEVNNNLKSMTQQQDLPSAGVAFEQINMHQQRRDAQSGPSPLSDELGEHRIFRTSPLTEVPFVCCPDC
jgi:hypothetical protein